MTRGVIRIAAAVIRDESGRLLFVRKTGTTAFMQPGGKREADESASETLVRELQEELGLRIGPDDLRRLGRFAADAANEPGMTVDAEVFEVHITDEPRIAAEIDEMIWLTPSEFADHDIAPLSRDVLVPLLLA